MGLSMLQSLPHGTMGFSMLQYLFFLVKWGCLCYSVSSSWYNGLSMLQYLFLLVQWGCLCYGVSSSWYNGFVYDTFSLPLGTMGLSE